MTGHDERSSSGPVQTGPRPLDGAPCPDPMPNDVDRRRALREGPLRGRHADSGLARRLRHRGVDHAQPARSCSPGSYPPARAISHRADRQPGYTRRRPVAPGGPARRGCAGGLRGVSAAGFGSHERRDRRRVDGRQAVERHALFGEQDPGGRAVGAHRASHGGCGADARGGVQRWVSCRTPTVGTRRRAGWSSPCGPAPPPS
jgi:hypothetical protein